METMSKTLASLARRSVLLTTFTVILSVTVCLLNLVGTHVAIETSHHATQSLDTPSRLVEEAKSCVRNDTIAYAITVTHCPEEGDHHGIIDGAAVLGHSIHRNSRRSSTSTSRYDYKLFAFVHADALGCVSSLRQLGYQVEIKHDLPFNSSKMSPFSRQEIEQRGCCGSKEFLKLYVYSLTDYPIAIHLDTDTLLVKPMDNLWDSLLGRDNLTSRDIASIQHHQLPSQPRIIDWSQVDSLFTRDYKQRSQLSKNPKHYGVQGGFLVVRPNQTLLDEISARIEGGQIDRRKGWAGLGYGGYWGDRQIQGFLSYIYGEYYSDRALELNRCRYNSMIHEDIYDSKTGECRTREATCEACFNTSWHDVVLVHLTTCRKPWECPFLRAPTPVLCRDAHRAWFETRRELELGWNQTPPRRGWNSQWTLSYCKNSREQKARIYQTIKLP